MKPRFLLDEHVDQAIQRQLLRLDPQIDILTVGGFDAPPQGTLDPDILIWIEERDYILVTANRSSMPVHLGDYLAEDRHIPGILWIRPSSSIGDIVNALYLIWYASTADEFQDRTFFIPL